MPLLPPIRPSWRRATTCLAVTATIVGGAAIATSAPAWATGVNAPGTIVYTLGGDIHITTPSGSAQVQVTHDGNTPTQDATGDTPYSVPSESDDGLIVAVRNQEFNKGKASEYTQGIIWELDRSGHVVRKFKPAQFDYIAGGGCQPANVEELPRGLFNAVVSPNGKYIAYTAQDYVQSPAPSCSTASGYSSWIANADGSNARLIADGQGDSASLEVGHFTADSSRLLVDRADFGSIELYTVPVTGAATAQAWTGPASGDFIDQAYQQADVRGGLLASVGYSKYTNTTALRLWSFQDFNHQPVAKCDWTSPVSSDINEWLGRPSFAPDASAVVFSDANGPADGATEGLYLLPASAMNNNCAGDQTLFIPHGEDPFWTAAGLYDPPTVTFTSHPAANTASRSGSIAFTGTDPDPSKNVVGYTCALDGGAAQGCTSPFGFSNLADGTHHLTVTATDGAQSGSAELSWRVDTAAPTSRLTAPTTVAVAAGSVRVSWSGSDAGSGIAHYQLRYRRAGYGSGFGSWTTPAAWASLGSTSLTAPVAAGYDYCWSVRAYDRAGNAGAWSSGRCTAAALDDRSLTASSGWSRRTGSAYYDRTVTTTTRRGAKLTRTHAVVDRVGVVATTCSSCGEVGLYVGSTRIGVVNLHASGTHQRVVKLLPSFRLRSGTVTVKVLSSGRAVAVDGLVLSRS